jgi:hypothetical protein
VLSRAGVEISTSPESKTPCFCQGPLDLAKITTNHITLKTSNQGGNDSNRGSGSRGGVNRGGHGGNHGHNGNRREGNHGGSI